jgi:hypothetical protein
VLHALPTRRGALRRLGRRYVFITSSALTWRFATPQVDRWNEQRENGNWPGRY